MVRYKFVHFNKRSDFDSYVPNPESNSANGNEYYNYVVFIKDTKEIYTHGQFYNCSNSGDSSIDEILEELKSSINSKADLSSLEALIKEVEENEEVTTAALTELHENKADKSEIPDVSAFATKDELNTLSAEVEEKVDSTTFTTLSETVAGHTTNINNLSNNKADKIDLENYAEKNALNTKQDQLVSGINIKTVNDNTILGSGNIETPDTKVTSAANHYGYNSNNATSTTGDFVTKITKDAANHVTSFESRALTSTDIPSLDASKITSGTFSIERLPAGALERMFVVASETAAMSAAVQEGDVVQVTGNDNKMYFCISNTATTFATKFKEFTAGTATSVPWSGITNKPDLVTQDEYNTLLSEFDNYLPKDGTAASATKLATSRTIWGQSFDGTGNVTGDMSGVGKFSANDNGYLTDIANGSINISFPVKVTGGWARGLVYKHLSNEAAFGNLAGVRGEGATLSYYFYGGDYGTGSHAMRLYDASQNYKAVFNGNVTAPTFTGNLVGNADSATKLATPRTIWGQSFDGTGDVSGDLSLYPQTQSLNASSGVLRFYSDRDAITGPAIHGVYAQQGYGAKHLVFYQHNVGGYTEYEAMRLTYDGNLVIGGTTADAKLHVHGDVKASSSITTSDKMYGLDFCTTSDNRLKDFTKDVIVDFNELKNIPKKYYYWKDKSMGEELQIGTSAQELAKVYPECVSYNEKEDRYSVNYQKLSIIALAAIDKLHDRISKLESKLYD